MNVAEYKTIIEKTAVFPTTVEKFGVAYSWLGMLGETAEAALCNDPNNLKKEIGDVLWYTAALCKETGASFENVIEQVKELMSYEPGPGNPGIIDIILFSENIKKFYRDKKELDLKRLEDLLSYNLCNLLQHQLVLASDLEEIMEMNYNKLMKRRATGTLHGSGDNRENE